MNIQSNKDGKPDLGRLHAQHDHSWVKPASGTFLQQTTLITGPEVIKLFSCSAKFSKDKFAIINNLRFFSRTNFMLR